MFRYFIELAYRGRNYAGFQIQQNANSVQEEVEKALLVFYRQAYELTGSSRTDAGVNALQNFFHVDIPVDHKQPVEADCYRLNAILPDDIVIKSIRPVKPEAHCRFGAMERQYRYGIYKAKDPFLEDRSYYYPYQLDMGLMESAAAMLMEYRDFTSFSKRNTQVKSFICELSESRWYVEGDQLYYTVRGNRFLRGMVRGLVGTMLQVGRGKLSLDEFRDIIEQKDCTRVDFAVPGHGLFLIKVSFPADLYI